MASRLGHEAIRGGAVTLGAQVFRLCVNLGATAVIARILTPRDYGLIAMIMVLTSFLALFREMGLSAATIQKPDLSDADINSMFWVNVSVGCLLTVVVLGLAPFLSVLYREPTVLSISMAMSACFLLSGLSVQHRALLRRHLRFTSLARVDMVRPVVSATVGIVMAIHGAGVWSLVGMRLAGWGAEVAGLWVACPWRPGRPRLSPGTGRMVSFGGFLTGYNLLNYFSRHADKMLIARLCGSASLGLYAKAYELLLMPLWLINTPMSSVAVPTLSKLQADPDRYRHAYGRAMRVLAYATTPITAVFAALSVEIMTVILGDQWIESGQLFRILAIAAFGQPIASATGWLFISLHRGRRMFQWGLISMPVYVGAFVVGIQWGVMGVAIAYAICDHLLRWGLFMWAYHDTPFSIRDLMSYCHRPIGLSLAILLAMAGTRAWLAHGIPTVTLWLRVGATLGVGLIVFALLVGGSAALRGDLRELASYRHSLRGRAARHDS